MSQVAADREYRSKSSIQLERFASLNTATQFQSRPYVTVLSCYRCGAKLHAQKKILLKKSGGGSVGLQIERPWFERGIIK